MNENSSPKPNIGLASYTHTRKVYQRTCDDDVMLKSKNILCANFRVEGTYVRSFV